MVYVDDVAVLGSEHPCLGVVVSTLAQYEHGKLSSSFVTSLSPPPPHDRDHTETAYVSLNGEVCWSKREIWTKRDGEQQCGDNFFNPSNPYFEKDFFVSGCSISLCGSGNQPLTVKVFTNLDQDATDESFGIDNVVIRDVGLYACPTTTTTTTTMTTTASPCTCMPYIWRSRTWHPINKRTGNSMSQLQYARICNVPTSITIRIILLLF